MRTEIDKQQTNMTIVHFSCQEREKKEKTQTIDDQRQSNHYSSTRVTLCERVHGYGSKEMVNDQI
jgi:hypothetical protein